MNEYFLLLKMTEFKLVQRKRYKQRNNKPLQSSANEVSRDLSADVDKEQSISKIKEACKFIQSSEFFQDVKDKLFKSTAEEPVESIISYGLGNFADCVIARYQLALLMALREHLQVPLEKCEIYDPKFWIVEKEILCDTGFTVIHKNEEGKRKTEVKTLYHMLHCGKSLYNNLLWSNWDPERLQQMVIIGNSFRNMIESTPRRLLEKSAGYILKIEPYIEEAMLPDNFSFSDVFNDTAVITFPQCLLKSAPQELWDNFIEPHYDDEDLEFIPNK